MDNNSPSTTSILTSLLGVALAASIIFGVWQYRKSGSLFAEKSTSELMADSLNTVSSRLQSNVATLEDKLKDRNQEFDELQLKYEENNQALAQKERMARQYRGELSTFKALDNEKAARLATLNKEIVELRTLKSSMEKQLKEIPELSAKLKAADMISQQRYEELEALNSRYNALDERYKDVIYYSPADNFKVEALKWNERVTAKAKKSRAIRVSFKLPAYLSSENAGIKPVYLTIIDGSTQPIGGVIKNINVMGLKETVPLEVHAMQDVNFSDNLQEIVFTVNLDEKVKPGNYTAKVYTSDDYLGSVAFNLRDSFLFF